MVRRAPSMAVNLDVTESAKQQVQGLIRTQKPGTVVRIYLQSSGGGCCGGGSCGCGASEGPSYALTFDRQRPGDEVVPVDGFAFVVDPQSAPQVDGARIDFVQELDQTGFRITSPHGPPSPESPKTEGQGGGCGCGAGGCC
jgi:Fe-S cluster assembly iron-binding protein IscA